MDIKEEIKYILQQAESDDALLWALLTYVFLKVLQREYNKVYKSEEHIEKR